MEVNDHQPHKSNTSKFDALQEGQGKGRLFKRGYITQWKTKQKQLDGFAELLQALTHIHCGDLKYNDLFSCLFLHPARAYYLQGKSVK